MNKKNRFNLSIFGATGAIGRFTFDIIDSIKNPSFDFFLFTGNKNIELMIKLIEKYNPVYAFMFDKKSNNKLKLILEKIKNNIDLNKNKNDLIKKNIISTKIIDSSDQIYELYSIKKNNNKKNELKKEHVFINGIMGYYGLIPTIVAMKNDFKIGIANKESVIIIGELFKNIGNLYPLDSEHFALFKIMKSLKKNEIKRLIITSSGGKVHGKTKDEIKKLKLSDILKHPNWNMGSKITIDSSTGMNKAFEVLEAHFLFNIPIEKIKVFINKQSNVHGIVETIDNTFYLQASIPDMHLSIYNFFKDVLNEIPEFNFKNSNYNSLNFKLENIEFDKFKVLKFLYENYKNIPILGIKYILINDYLLEKIINKNLEFYKYNDEFFRLLNKIKNLNIDFSLDANLIILSLERLKEKLD